MSTGTNEPAQRARHSRVSTLAVLLVACAWSPDSASSQSRDPRTAFRADRACAKNIPPTAVAEFPQTVRVGEPVTFSGENSSDPDGEIYALYWWLGDGATSRGRTVRHTYDAAGEYQVVLRVVDLCMASSPDVEGVVTVVDCLADSDCDDGLYCNGVESCVGGVCHSGVAVDCDDDVACTDDSCNEDSDSCDNVPNDTACDNSLFCDGTETCNVNLGCQAGSDPCVGQLCDEAENTCVECLDDSDCDDELFCTGIESCNLDGLCVDGVPPCTEDQACDEENDECDAGGTGDPGVSFTFTPEAPQVHDVVTFSAACEWENENVIYYWSFCDGRSTYADTFTRDFTDPVTYTFSLTAYDTNTGYYETVDGEIEVLPGLTLLGLLEGDIGDARGLEVVGTTAWVAGGQQDGLGRLVTVDVSDPAAPELMSEHGLYGYLWDLAVADDLVAVAASYGGVYLFDSNPESLSQVGHFDCYGLDGSYAYGVALTRDEAEGQDWLYVAAGSELKIVNVSDPGSPAWVGSVGNLGWLSNRVLIQDQYLYVGDSTTPAVHVLDITSPDGPLSVFDIPTDARPYDMCVRGSLLAVIENNIGQDPQSAGKLAFFEVGAGPTSELLSRVGNSSACYRSVALSGERAFVTNLTSAVVFNIAAPETPLYTETTSLTCMGSAVRLGPDGRVYTGLWTAMLAILDP